MHKRILAFSALLLTVSFITACDGDPLATQVTTLKQDSLNNFLFMKGGTFTMGDFGTQVNGKTRRFSLFSNAPPHEVTLSSYSLAKYKVTWSDYDTYLLATGRPVQEIVNFNNITRQQSWGEARTPRQTNEQREERENDWTTINPFYYLKPASVQWQDAKDYCHWLGEELGLPIDLATEAQWEYAARSGGYPVLYANAQGDIHTPPTVRYIDKEPEIKLFPFSMAPVGTLSTANAAGFYDMDTNGREWVNDWYSKTYYKDFPKITYPQGPDTGVTKVMRVLPLTFEREATLPTRFTPFRCAVNSPEPVRKQ